MVRGTVPGMLLLALLAGAATPLAAQQAPAREGSSWSMLRIAKWTTLAASAGAAIYGFTAHARADRDYEALEALCGEDPVLCRARTPAGSYQDADLEARYQDVLGRDRNARTALLASQLGVVASVVLFIVDLRNARAPDDILYEPRPLQVSPRHDGGVELRLTLPTR